jgi:hypothetical protein
MPSASKLVVAAACVAGVAGFAPAGLGNLRLRSVNAEARLSAAGPRLRAAPSKLTMMAEKVNVKRYGAMSCPCLRLRAACA